MIATLWCIKQSQSHHLWSLVMLHDADYNAYLKRHLPLIPFSFFYLFNQFKLIVNIADHSVSTNLNRRLRQLVNATSWLTVYLYFHFSHCLHCQ